MLIFTPLKFRILSTSSTFCSAHSIEAVCPWLFWRRVLKPESAPAPWPCQEYTRWKQKIQTKLALLSGPEFAVREAYEKSTWFNPKKSNWQLWRQHTPQKVLTLVLLDVARGSLHREDDWKKEKQTEQNNYRARGEVVVENMNELDSPSWEQKMCLFHTHNIH